MFREAGIRVGAILSSDAESVRFLGYGVYEGDFAPPGSQTPEQMLAELEKEDPEWAESVIKETSREQVLESIANSPFLKNPRIKLDSGDTVWGQECWWGPEDKIKQNLAECEAGGKKIVMTTIKRDEQGRALGTEELKAA